MADDKKMDRKDAVPALIGDPDDFLIVSGLAGASKDVGALTQGRPNAYHLAGVMGAAVMIGAGLALAQPDRQVLVVTGDGELLMALGSLATVAAMALPNLSIVCVDNGRYGETGYQVTHTDLGTDLTAVASAAGIPNCREINEPEDITDAAQLIRQSNATSFVLLKVSDAPPPADKRSFDAAATKTAFRQALLGEN